MLSEKVVRNLYWKAVERTVSLESDVDWRYRSANKAMAHAYATVLDYRMTQVDLDIEGAKKSNLSVEGGL